MHKENLSVEDDRAQIEVDLVGESPKLQKVIATAKKIARSSSMTTLIVGESGTGKELVARLIHKLSNTSTQPFIDINGGAIPETLLESELFGYEKGAFTGAQMQKKGLFEMANGGKIFLDGNVRQLRNAIERAVLVECDEWIEADDILLESERENQPAADRVQKV